MFFRIKDSCCQSDYHLFVSSVALVKFWLLSKLLVTLHLFHSYNWNMVSNGHLTP